MFRLSYLVIIAFIVHVLWEEQTSLDVSHFALYKFTTYFLLTCWFDFDDDGVALPWSRLHIPRGLLMERVALQHFAAIFDIR